MRVLRRIKNKLVTFDRRIYTFIKLRNAHCLGNKVVACRKLHLINPQYLSIGDGCYFGPDCRIEAWNEYNGKKYDPKIVFGKSVRINSTCHIGAINRVEIGNCCLIGSHVMIIDHSHGRNSKEELSVHPSERNLFSKGGIIIGDHCWICENVVVLPGVHIGSGTTIGANSVVTHDIPSNCVAVGNPARIVKKIME